MPPDAMLRSAVESTADTRKTVEREAADLESLYGQDVLEVLRPARIQDADNERGLSQARWAAVALTALVIGVRLWFVSRLQFCGTPDSCFYLGLAQGIERTGSFRVNFLYDLLLPKLQLPSPGINYWRPGTAFLLLPAHLWGGVTLHSGAVMATLAGVLWAAAAWHVARSAAATRAYTLPCYGLALLLPATWTGSLVPDSTLFYAAAVAWFLALFTVRRQGLWQDLVALACVSVAYLIRNDALLLLMPLLAVLALRYRRVKTSREGTRTERSLLYACLMMAGFVAALSPMHAIYHHVLGTAMPGGTAQALWLNDLSDFNLYGVVPTATGLLAYGVGHLLTMRAQALILIVYRVLAILVGYSALVFLPGLFAGLRQPSGLRKDPAPERHALPEMAGPAVFALTIVLVYSLVLPAIGVFSALRSVVGVLPWVAVLAIAGLLRAVPDRRVALGICGALLAAYAVNGAMATRREVEDKNLLGDRDRRLASALAALGAAPEKAVVMTGDPVQFAVTTGYAAVPVPGNGLDAAHAEARALGVTHVILNTDWLRENEGEVARILGVRRGVTLPGEKLTLLQLERPNR